MNAQEFTIGITYTENIKRYHDWFSDALFPVKTITLCMDSSQPIKNSIQKNLSLLSSLDGIVFSGGDDFSLEKLGIANDPEIIKRYHLVIDEKKDEFEWELAQRAIELKLPTFAICRGMQLINLVLGGTIFLDLEEERGNSEKHKAISKTQSRYHLINIYKNSYLFNIIQTSEGIVNSRHHQAVKELAPQAIAVATSPDNIIEAIELKDRSYPFLGVQWHPELMGKDDVSSYDLLSLRLRDEFLNLISQAKH